jgi:dihydroflavonol-4-reductase
VLDSGALGTRETLGAARRRGLENIVVTSSCAVLGTTSTPEPMDETHPFNLKDPEPYIQAKVDADAAVEEMLAAGMPIVRVMPSGVFGPGDWKPTPNGQGIIEYMKLSPGLSVPVSEGGISVVDVDDVVEGHIRAMEVGEIGERYILGGDNLTYSDFFRILADLTGLAEPSDPKGPLMIGLIAKLMELRSALTGKPPALTSRLARDYAHSYVWVTSEKAERALGYQHRPARETLARAVRFFIEKGYLPGAVADQVRLELRPV